MQLSPSNRGDFHCQFLIVAVSRLILVRILFKLSKISSKRVKTCMQARMALLHQWWVRPWHNCAEKSKKKSNFIIQIVTCKLEIA